MSIEIAAYTIIFWYGVLHAFGPDHLTAIADFSIGKESKKTFWSVGAFALGHGMMLFMFAKALEYYTIPSAVLAYGDTIASCVIMGIGVYLLTMVYRNRIQVKSHLHGEKQHIHIWFGDEHQHTGATTSAFSVGVMMGIGGVRGMLITLGALYDQAVDFLMIVFFILGVMSVFFVFGLLIFWLNKEVLTTLKNIRRAFAIAGIVSLCVGGNMFFA